MDDAVRHLLDRLAIQDVQIEYARALDANEWDRLDQVFLPESIADYAGIAYCEGLPAIKEICSGALTRLTASQHLCGNHWASISGDTAVAGCYLQAQHSLSGTPGGDNFIIAGTYTDQLARTADGWRIAHRTLTPVWSEGNPAVVAADEGQET